MAELKLKRDDELLKTSWTTANDSRNEDIKMIKAVESAGGVDSDQGQAILQGYGIENVDKLLEAKARAEAAGVEFKWASLPVAGDRPLLNYGKVEDYYKAEKGGESTLGSILTDLGLKKEHKATEKKDATLTDPTYTPGASVPLTDKQQTRLNKLNKTPPEMTWSEKKFKQLQGPIYEAVTNDTLIAPGDWRAFKLYTTANKDAMSTEMMKVLSTLEKKAHRSLSFTTKQYRATNSNGEEISASMGIIVDEKSVIASWDNIVKRARQENKDPLDIYAQLYKKWQTKIANGSAIIPKPIQ